MLHSIVRKPDLKLLGITFNQDPCKWETHFDLLLCKASSGLLIIRVCKFYGYSQEELTTLINSLIMSLLLYAIENWGSKLVCKYLRRIVKFCKCAHKYGYLLNFTPIKDILHARDKLSWEQIMKNCNHCLRDLLLMQRGRSLCSHGHNYILLCIRTERSKRTFINRCLLVLFRLQLVFSLVMNFCKPCTFVCRYILLCN